MTTSSFAHRLKDLRETAGLSQYALAKKTGLTKQAISLLELGQSVPRWPTVQLLAQALGVDCTSFVDPELKPPPEEPAAPRGRPRKVAAATTAATGDEGPPKKDADLVKPPVKKMRTRKGG